MRESFSFGSLLAGGRRNIVVTPGRPFRISLLVTLVLLCTLSCVIEPGTAELLRKSSFSILDASGEDGCWVRGCPESRREALNDPILLLLPRGCTLVCYPIPLSASSGSMWGLLCGKHYRRG